MSDDAGQQTRLDEIANESKGDKIEESDYSAPDTTEDLPNDWEIVTVEELYTNLLGGGTPSKDNEQYWGGGIPWASVKDLDGITLSETQDYITQEGLYNSATNLIPPHSIIISTRMTVGEPFVNLTEMAINQDMKGIIPDQNIINTYYFVYNLRKKDPYLKSIGRGTTVDGITTSDLERTHIELPPLSEQQKVASILYNLDEAINKTEEIIQQTKRVKKGVMQDVFKYGLNKESTLRDENELQETYLGKIPQEWRLRQISDICLEVVDCPHSTPNYEENTDDGILVARTSEIEDGRFTEEEAPRVTEDEYIDRISRLEPEPGDIIFTREAPIGEAFKIPEGMKICLGQRVMILRPDQDTLLSDYLLELIYSDMMQSWFERSARGTTSTHMNVGDVEELEIPLPDIEEQRRITSVLNDYREKIENEMQLRDRLKHLKKGLMQDLLTGEVRTVDRDIDILPEVENHG